ncbi:hypothetical protein H5410_021048 [Solanum commersonii]|uniref:Uncharacterized protein n=1 Tax=Solanum commersonii TaxID=4109 RepID=A0A9J5ZCW5_SOLCO|nr:hypothetical protein H5410_021048 [Solanum commersonii]
MAQPAQKEHDVAHVAYPACIAWNVRGLNKEHKQVEFKNFWRSNKVAIILVLEHKIKEGKASNVIQKIVGKWEIVDNYAADPRGRIWILWDPSKVQFIKKLFMDMSHLNLIKGFSLQGCMDCAL